MSSSLLTVSTMRARMESVLYGLSPNTLELFSIYRVNVGPCRLWVLPWKYAKGRSMNCSSQFKVPQGDKTGLESSNL